MYFSRINRLTSLQTPSHTPPQHSSEQANSLPKTTQNLHPDHTPRDITAASICLTFNAKYVARPTRSHLMQHQPPPSRSCQNFRPICCHLIHPAPPPRQPKLHKQPPRPNPPSTCGQFTKFATSRAQISPKTRVSQVVCRESKKHHFSSIFAHSRPFSRFFREFCPNFQCFRVIFVHFHAKTPNLHIIGFVSFLN